MADTRDERLASYEAAHDEPGRDGWSMIRRVEAAGLLVIDPDDPATREAIARAIMGKLYAGTPLSRPVLQQADAVLAALRSEGNG